MKLYPITLNSLFIQFIKKGRSGLFILLTGFLLTLSQAVETEAERNATYLLGLSLEELVKVEVTLDEVFNVFDGLIETKKVTVATGRRQPTDRAPAVTTVITAQDIEAMGAQDLDEVLETVPGLHVAFFAARYDPIYIIRGIYSDFNPQVLLLINGIPLKGLLTGHRTVVGNGIPINAIKRIEVATGLPVPPDSDLIPVTPFVKEGDRKNQYLFLQDGWKLFPNLELTTGIRYDHYSDFGSTVNPRIALVWQMRSDLTSKLLYGKAFRAPAFLELYAINSPVAQGNPHLEPETLDSIEFALSYRITSRLNLETNLFRYQTADTIRYVRENPQTVPLAQNIGNQEGFGFEGEIRWKMTPKSGLLSNYAFVKVTDEQQRESGNYPRHSGYLRIDYLLHPHWYLDLSMNWVADRKRVFGDIRPQIADYTTVNLTIRYKDIRDGHQYFAL